MMLPTILLIVAALVVGVFILLEGLSGPGDEALPLDRDERGETVPIDAAISYDPEGGDGEHDEVLGNAVDGDRETFWQTEGYNSPDMDKDGVGLVVQLEEETEISALRIRSDTPGWRFSVYAGTDTDFELDEEERVSSVDGEDTFEASGSRQIEFEPVSATYVMIWLTELNDFIDDGYRAYVNEVDVYGSGG
jgi:hypothetical protein